MHFFDTGLADDAEECALSMGHEGPLVALWAIKHGVDQMKLPSWMDPAGEVVGLRTAEEENEWHTGVGLGYANIPDVDHADDYTAGNVANNMVAHELDRERSGTGTIAILDTGCSGATICRRKLIEHEEALRAW